MGIGANHPTKCKRDAARRGQVEGLLRLFFSTLLFSCLQDIVFQFVVFSHFLKLPAAMAKNAKIYQCKDLKFEFG